MDRAFVAHVPFSFHDKEGKFDGSSSLEKGRRKYKGNSDTDGKGRRWGTDCVTVMLYKKDSSLINRFRVLLCCDISRHGREVLSWGTSCCLPDGGKPTHSYASYAQGGSGSYFTDNSGSGINQK